MHRLFNILIVFTMALAVMSLKTANAVSAETATEVGQLRVYLFAQEGCPYCKAAQKDLMQLASGQNRIQLLVLQLGGEPHALRWYEFAIDHFGHQQAAVPLVVIGERSFLGYLSGGGSRKSYQDAISQCLSSRCDDVIAKFAFGAAAQTGVSENGTFREERPQEQSLLPESIHIPLFGDLRTESLSLSALTVLMAAVDGFNPCAMWVLVFLIGLLLGLEDRKRMWILGAAFLAATAAMYFAVMAAWLNIILFLDQIIWIRIAIGLLAVGAGLFFLREYWTKAEAACHVTNPGRRAIIMETFRSMVNKRQLFLSVLGIMALAVLVNFIELLCSAGIPAVYTQVLTLSDLQPMQYYGFLALYLSVFLLDDIAIFATAMIALRVSGLTGKYTRFSHLVGGILLLAIGAMLLLKPELLSFG